MLRAGASHKVGAQVAPSQIPSGHGMFRVGASYEGQHPAGLPPDTSGTQEAEQDAEDWSIP